MMSSYRQGIETRSSTSQANLLKMQEVGSCRCQLRWASEPRQVVDSSSMLPPPVLNVACRYCKAEKQLLDVLLYVQKVVLLPKLPLSVLLT
jgi:hypothetical protein